MKIVHIAAGAGGMLCGSCLRDNALASALIAQGRDALLVPAYAPMRTDEPSASAPRVVFGALNVFLQHWFPPFRWSPEALKRLLDSPRLLRGVSRFSRWTRPQSLGAMALTVLQGEEGRTAGELKRLARWLAEEVKPQIVILPNSMLCAMAREIKRQTGAPVLCMLSGEDAFLEGLPQPFKDRCLEALRRRAPDCDGFIAPSRYCADFMADYLRMDRRRIHLVPLGINLEGHGPTGPRRRDPFTAAFLARIHPQKGLRELAEAFILLKRTPEGHQARLRVAGWLDPKERGYLNAVRRRIHQAGCAQAFEYVGELDRPQKIAFLREASVLSVPAPYPEPKGLYVIEALANGVPVALPRSGSFPEMVEGSGGGLLVNPAGGPAALAEAFVQMIRSPEEADEMGRRGRNWARSGRGAAQMAEAAYALYERYATTQL